MLKEAKQNLLFHRFAPVPLPSFDYNDYEAIIIMDASATGYGGQVWLRDRIYEVKAGFRNAMSFSARAEP